MTEHGNVVSEPPKHWEGDVLLLDGSTAHIRPIRPEDADLLVEFYAEVSDESKYYRFFSPMPRLSDRDVARFTQVDHHDRVAMVLILAEKMIAVGRFDVVKPGEAEVAFLVQDAHQGRGSLRSCWNTSRRPAVSSGWRSSSPRCCPTTVA
ncbi:GNAT family N-acetyltransferase [Nocardioides alcanivorans]|uniref:GNAT family N-acetyltransferase n=1 Tax=Nocardioides alcanivorans TaxID=2897352 RepID=UPI001F476B1B|nr:GNAT family N-acetyltransferase [Nocardioides alcanivorans]